MKVWSAFSRRAMRRGTTKIGVLLPLLLSTPAFAVATVNVTGNLGVQFQYYQDASGQIFDEAPAGVVIQCTEQGFTTCNTSWTLSASNPFQTLQSPLSITGGEVMVLNTTDQAISGELIFLETYTAYAAGAQGVRVDDPATEFASFASFVDSPDIYEAGFIHIQSANVIDQVNCATNATTPSCSASDSGGSFLFAMPIASPGVRPYTQAFLEGGTTAELVGSGLVSVAEPPAWSYFAAVGLLMGAWKVQQIRTRRKESA